MNQNHNQTSSNGNSLATDKPAGADADRRDSFHDRLGAAAGDVSYRKLGRLTETHPETVRRYMQGQAPSATFLTNMCRVLGISGEWLLTGRGPMKCTDMKSHALSNADPSELLTAVANTLTDLCDRMDRIERFVQSLETRVHARQSSEPRANERPKASKLNGVAQASTPERVEAQAGSDSMGADEQQPHAIEPKPDGTSVERIRAAIAKRSS